MIGISEKDTAILSIIRQVAHKKRDPKSLAQYAVYVQAFVVVVIVQLNQADYYDGEWLRKPTGKLIRDIFGIENHSRSRMVAQNISQYVKVEDNGGAGVGKRSRFIILPGSLVEQFITEINFEQMRSFQDSRLHDIT